MTMRVSRTPAIAAALAAVALHGCGTPPTRGTPLPENLSNLAKVPSIADAGRWGDERPAGLDAWLTLPEQQPRVRFGGVMDRPHDYLVISGGGSGGALGAGLLAGWSALGTRPEFQLVTGTSNAVLIAPLAFLGSGYDPLLRDQGSGEPWETPNE